MSARSTYNRRNRSESEDLAFDSPRNRGGVDVQFLILTIVLLVLGLIALFSASFPKEYYRTASHNPFGMIIRQLGWVAAGLVLMYLASRLHIGNVKPAPPDVPFLGKIEYFKVRARAMTIMRLTLLLLVPLAIIGGLYLFLGKVVHAPAAAKAVRAFGNSIGVLTVNGATRWLFFFQPSEFAKVGLILGIASIMCRSHFKTRHIIAYAGATVIMLLCQPHLSASIIVIAITIVMLYTGGALRNPIMFVGIGLAFAALFIIIALTNAKFTKLSTEYYDNRDTGMSHSAAIEIYRDGVGMYQFGRVVSWLHPDFDTQGESYQANQSLLAVGSGGLLGQGLTKSRQKYFYLPEAQNDYIFAIWCEEMGFVGTIPVIVIFLLLILRGLWIAIHARDRYTSLVVVGIMTMLGVQVFFNIGVVTNYLPSTGISLPFFSYGGTALMVQLGEMGIVLSASRDMHLTKRG